MWETGQSSGPLPGMKRCAANPAVETVAKGAMAAKAKAGHGIHRMASLVGLAVSLVGGGLVRWTGWHPPPSPRDDSVADCVEPPKQVQAAQEEADNKPPPLFFEEEDLKQEVRNCAGHDMASGGRPPRRWWWTPPPGPQTDSH